MLFYSYILHTYISQHYYICIVLFIYSIFFSYLPCRHTYHMIQTSRAVSDVKSSTFRGDGAGGGLWVVILITQTRVFRFSDRPEP